MILAGLAKLHWSLTSVMNPPNWTPAILVDDTLILKIVLSENITIRLSSSCIISWRKLIWYDNDQKKAAAEYCETLAGRRSPNDPSDAGGRQLEL